MRTTTTFMAAAAAVALLSGSAFAQGQGQDGQGQQNQQGLVNVAVGDVSVLQNVGIQVPADIDLSQNPITVQVPVGIAAQVCGVEANVIAQDKGAQDAICTIEQSQDNEAFNNLLQRNQESIEADLEQATAG